MVPCGLWLVRQCGLGPPVLCTVLSSLLVCLTSATQKLHGFSSIPNNTYQPFCVLHCLGCPSPPSACWICTRPSRSDFRPCLFMRDFLAIPSNRFDVSCPASSPVMAPSDSVLSVCMQDSWGTGCMLAYLSSLTYSQYSISCVSC